MIKSRFLALTALVLMAAPAMAADLVEAPPPPAPVVKDWRFQATIYGWAAGIDGDIGIAGLGPAHVNVSPSEAIESLKGAVMGAFSATNGDWLFLTDLIWNRTNSTGPIGATGAAYDFTQNQYIVQSAVGYRLPIDIDRFTLSGTVGFRYMYLDGDLGLGTIAVPNVVSASGHEQWIDPTVGLSLRYDFNDKWFLNALGDIGGFGVGSDLTWQAFGAVGYNWTKTISTSIGYRALYEDYTDGGFVYNVTQQGVFAGLGIHF